jgi:hypothetical protein
VPGPGTGGRDLRACPARAARRQRAALLHRGDAPGRARAGGLGELRVGHQPAHPGTQGPRLRCCSDTGDVFLNSTQHALWFWERPPPRRPGTRTGGSTPLLSRGRAAPRRSRARPIRSA